MGDFSSCANLREATCLVIANIEVKTQVMRLSEKQNNMAFGFATSTVENIRNFNQ
jgi:hypothetical protein